MFVDLDLLAVTGWLIVAMPKVSSPNEDTGLSFGFLEASPDVSFVGYRRSAFRSCAHPGAQPPPPGNDSQPAYRI